MPLVSPEEAAEVLGIKVGSVYALASDGAITRQAPRWGRGQAYDLDEVEARSLARLGYHNTGHPYWLNVSEVADYLGVTVSRVRQLLDAEKIPAVNAPNGRRYVRRNQLEVIANARDARAGRFPLIDCEAPQRAATQVPGMV